jgi:hypothetical protein
MMERPYKNTLKADNRSVSRSTQAKLPVPFLLVELLEIKQI